MKKHRQTLAQNFLLYTVFVLYIIILFRILIFSRGAHSSINLVPFHSIMDYLSGSNTVSHRFAFINIFGNIILFVPLGIYLSLFKHGKRIGTNVLWILIISLLVEIAQYIFGIGASDIDDVILNSLGGLIGVVAYKALSAILKDENKVRFVITIASTIIAIPIIFLLSKLKIKL